MKHKKMLAVFLALVISVFFAFSAFASSSTWSTGRQVFPSWVDFQAMETLAMEYGYDSYFVYFAAGGTQSDGSATYNYCLYNSPETLYYSSGKIYNSSSRFYVYCWNTETSSFDYYKYFTSITISAGDELYFSDNILDSSGTLIYSAGPSAAYVAVLEDDMDYQDYISGGSGGDDAGTDTGDDLSNSGLLSGFKNSITNLGNRISGFFDTLLDGIIGIFIPSEDFLNSSLDRVKFIVGLSDTSSTESNFISVIVSFGTRLLDFVSGDFSTPPVLTIDLTGFGSYGLGVITFVDFSWLDPYISDVHFFMSAFLWASYLWLLYKRLPGILSGLPMQGGAD